MRTIEDKTEKKKLTTRETLRLLLKLNQLFVERFTHPIPQPSLSILLITL